MNFTFLKSNAKKEKEITDRVQDEESKQRLSSRLGMRSLVNFKKREDINAGVVNIINISNDLKSQTMKHQPSKTKKDTEVKTRKGIIDLVQD